MRLWEAGLQLAPAVPSVQAAAVTTEADADAPAPRPLDVAPSETDGGGAETETDGDTDDTPSTLAQWSPATMPAKKAEGRVRCAWALALPAPCAGMAPR